MFVDYVLNGQGFGEVAEAMVNSRFDPGVKRPYLDSKGRACVSVSTGRMVANADYGKVKGAPQHIPEVKKRFVSEMINNGMVFNAPTSLRKDDWIMLDNTVIRAYRERLRAWSDLSAASTFGGFNGMSKIMLEYQTMNDPGEAFVDMDGMTEGRNDAPRFNLQGLPLPITHSDFWFSSRQLAVSRNSNTPLDTTMAEAAARRVAERIEQTTIGIEAGIEFGANSQYANTAKVYGYTNYPDRITKSDLTAPTDTGWTPATLIGELLEMIDLAGDAGFYGPFMLYTSTDWDAYLDNDYNENYGGVTLRQRIRAIEAIRDVRRLDFLKSATNPFTLLLIEMTPRVVRAVNGMDITTVQWESMGGMRLNFKVMAIQVPQIRSDWDGNTGIVHATTA